MSLMYKLFAILFFLIALVKPSNSKANHIAGGDIYYKYIEDSTYEVTVRIYWNCKNDFFTATPATMPLCIRNSCSSFSATVNLAKYPDSAQIPEPCPSMPTRCTNPTASIDGYYFMKYTGLITLPGRCKYWKFSTSYDHRDFSLNGSISYYYVEATFDNTGSYKNNSSPVSTTHGNLYACNGVAFTYNSGVIDPDGDSIATEVIHPQQVLTGTCPQTSSNISFSAKTPSLSIPNNPFQTNNTFSCNPVSGDLNFTPGEAGPQLVNLRFNEYRGGKLIGYTTKEINFRFLNCSSSTAPLYKLNTFINCSYSSNTIYACMGKTIAFNMDILSATPGASYIVTDNHNVFAPTASISYTNQGRDSIRMGFSWTPPVTAKNTYNFVLTVKDSTCTPAGVILYKTIYIPIVMVGKPTAYIDTTICNGQSATLRGYDGGNYTWSVLSGTPGSIGCPTCTTTTVTPVITTKYLLTSGISAFCGNNLDTATVGVINPTTPSISISHSPTGIVKIGSPVTFTATGIACTSPIYTWKKNGVVTGSGTIYTTTSLMNGDVITCEMQCNDLCATTKSVTSNSITASVGIANFTRKDDNLTIIPNPNTGKLHLSGNTKILEGTIDITNMLGQTIYTGNATQTEIDLGNVANGLYHLRYSKYGEVKTLLFVVEK